MKKFEQKVKVFDALTKTAMSTPLGQKSDRIKRKMDWIEHGLLHHAATS